MPIFIVGGNIYVMENLSKEILKPNDSNVIDNQKRIEQIAGLLLIAVILAGCAIVLKPFIVAILWAAILCFATWPIYELLLKWLKGRRTLASLIMTILIVVVIFLPFFMVGLTFTESVQSAMQWLESHKQDALFTPPVWIQKIPLVGQRLFSYLSKLASDVDPAIQSIRPWILKAGVWLLQHSLDLVQGILQLAMSILIAFLPPLDCLFFSSSNPYLLEIIL